MKFFSVFSVLLLFLGVFDSVAKTEQNFQVLVMNAHGQEYLGSTGAFHSLAGAAETRAGIVAVRGDVAIDGRAAADFALNLIADSLQKTGSVFDSPNEYVFDQKKLNGPRLSLPDDVEVETPFRNIPLAFYEKYQFLVLSFVALCVVALAGFFGAGFFWREQRLRGERRQEMARARQIERYQNAMIAWSEISHENIGEAFRRATEISSRTLDVRRVSIWLYDEDKTSIKCHVMYVEGCGFSSGGVLREKTSLAIFPR